MAYTKRGVLEISANLDLTWEHEVVVFNTAAAARTAKLPTLDGNQTHTFVCAGANTLTVDRNGANINGAAENLTLLDGESVTLVSVAGNGWRITNGGSV